MLPANILLQEIAKLKSGEDIFNEDGSLKYKNEAVTLPPKKSRSFAYCTDTIYTESFLHQITGIDLLYHESTFLKDLTLRAKETYHSTAEEAATIALKAGVEKLIIGHFSSRYKDLQPLLSEARETFPNTFLAIEGDTFSIPEE